MEFVQCKRVIAVAAGLVAAWGVQAQNVTVQLTDGTPLPALSPGSVTIPAAKNVIVYATGSATDSETYPLGLVQQVLDVPTEAAPTTTTTAPPAAQGVTASPAVTG